MAPFRAWVVFKESNYGSVGADYRADNRAWFCTHAGSSDKDCTELSTENGGVDDDDETVKVRVQRRQRSGGGGGDGPAVVGTPDLLAIPGVGPRNLRKLVKKGFEGVAQLKQLYKDKVCRFMLLILCMHSLDNFNRC